MGVLDRVNAALCSHTRAQYYRQFRLFLAFALARRLCTFDNVTSLLLFLEFLASQSLSSRVILNYMSALKHYFLRYSWRAGVLSSPLVISMLKGIKLSVHKPPTPKMLFILGHLREISGLCEYFPSPITYRAAFLTAFYGFLRISNIAPLTPLFRKLFDASKHFIRGDVIFTYPGCHLPLKWAKNLQAPERVHFCKL